MNNYLIAQPRNGSEDLALVSVARELNWDIELAPSGWRLDENHVIKPGIPYGSQIFCEVISQQMNWNLILNSFDWLSTLPFEVLGRKIEFMTLKDALKINVPKFIKPADDKVFPCKVYQTGQEINLYEGLSLETPTLVSDPVNFVSEYRCFVKDQRILTASCYKLGDEINNPNNWEVNLPEVLSTLSKWLKEGLIISKPAVIDVGYLDNGQLVVIESNPAWASGIYGCDLWGVLEVLQESVSYEKNSNN